MAIKKFGEWCQQFDENDTAGLSGGYLNKLNRATDAGEAANLNKSKIEFLVDTFLKNFNTPAQQRMAVAVLRKRLMHARDMFKPEEEVPE
jgi:hypothetical protein